MTNQALVDLCSGIVPGCKTTMSTAKTMARMHLSFCRGSRFHPHRCQPLKLLQRNRTPPVRQRSQQQRGSQRCLKLRNHRPRVLLLQQSLLLVSLISPSLYISEGYSFIALFVLGILISTSPLCHRVRWCTRSHFVSEKVKSGI